MHRNPHVLFPYHERKAIKASIIDFLLYQECTHFLTFMPNRDMTIERLRARVKAWHAQIDRALLGRNWASKAEERTFLVGFFEKPEVNIHVHGIVRFSRRPTRAVVTAAKSYWKALVPSGKLDFQRIEDPKAVMRYVTKGIGHRRLYESFFILPEQR